MMVALAQPRRALAALLDGLVSSGTDLSVSVRGVETDSRRVRDGGLFLACSGFESHGLNYVDDALKHGAAAVLWEPEPGVEVPQLNVPAWPVEQLRQHVGEIAAPTTIIHRGSCSVSASPVPTARHPQPICWPTH